MSDIAPPCSKCSGRGHLWTVKFSDSECNTRNTLADTIRVPCPHCEDSGKTAPGCPVSESPPQKDSNYPKAENATPRAGYPPK